jgi:capsular exopolysaccharide synthesis family protein
MPDRQLINHDRDEARPALKRELAILRRNWLIALICVVVAPIAAYAYSKSQTTEYTATASLLFTSGGAEQRIFGLEPTGNTDPAREAATNLKLASLEALSVRTAKGLKSDLSGAEVREKVSVSPEGESELVSISATDPSPAFAARLANEFAQEFVSFGREIETAKVKRSQKLAEAQLEGLSEEERVGTTGRTLQRRIVELETVATIQTGRAEVAQPATTPESPSSPNTKKNVALGLVVGILLALAAIFLREQLDRRIRGPEEIEELYGVPILGTVPTSKAAAHGGGDAAVSEAVLMLRANLRYIDGARERRSLLLTSAAPQEGKTMVAWNLARASAGAGERVLLIEADLRRPTLAEVAGTTSTDGLGLVLAGGEHPERAIRTIAGVDLLPAGPAPPNPAELIEGARMTKLLEWAESNYDRVIIDTPPASLVADAVPLFGQVGAILTVARLGHSARDAVEHLSDQLRRLHAPLVGVVVNGAPRPTETSYYRPWHSPQRGAPDGPPESEIAWSNQRSANPPG